MTSAVEDEWNEMFLRSGVLTPGTESLLGEYCAEAKSDFE